MLASGDLGANAATQQSKPRLWRADKLLPLHWFTCCPTCCLFPDPQPVTAAHSTQKSPHDYMGFLSGRIVFQQYLIYIKMIKPLCDEESSFIKIYFQESPGPDRQQHSYIAAYKQTYNNYRKEDKNTNELSNSFLWSNQRGGMINRRLYTLPSMEYWCHHRTSDNLPTIHNTNWNIP